MRSNDRTMAIRITGPRNRVIAFTRSRKGSRSPAAISSRMTLASLVLFECALCCNDNKIPHIVQSKLHHFRSFSVVPLCCLQLHGTAPHATNPPQNSIARGIVPDPGTRSPRRYSEASPASSALDARASHTSAISGSFCRVYRAAANRHIETLLRVFSVVCGGHLSTRYLMTFVTMVVHAGHSKVRLS